MGVFDPGAFEAAVVYTDSLGGMDADCPTAAEDPFAPTPVKDVVIDPAINEGVGSFTRSVIAPEAEPFVALDLGPAAGLCR